MASTDRKVNRISRQFPSNINDAHQILSLCIFEIHDGNMDVKDFSENFTERIREYAGLFESSPKMPIPEGKQYRKLIEFGDKHPLIRHRILFVF